MCPQPLSKASKSGNYVLSNDPLMKTPELGALVATAIAGWAMIETLLGDSFVALIGRKQPVTMSMYTALTSPELRQKLFEAAAKELLPLKYANLVSDVLAALDVLAQKRHKFAHWLWGRPTDPELAGTLILVHPKHHWDHLMATAKHWRRPSVRKDPLVFAWRDTPKLDANFIFVYRAEELRQVCDEMDGGYKQAQMLHDMMFVRPARRKELYSRLYAEPAIRVARNQRKKKSQKAAQKAPPK